MEDSSRVRQGRVRKNGMNLNSAPSWGSRLAGIEGLRGLAALGVVVTHAGSILAPATASGVPGIGFARHGLTLFFALSGFLLYRPFVLSLIAGKPHPPARAFLRNRIIRIFPGYLTVLLIVNLLSLAALPPSEYGSGVKESGSLSFIDFIINATLLQTYMPYYFHSGLSVAWSLSVEVTFYFLLPLIAYLGRALVVKPGYYLAAIAPALLLLLIGAMGKVWLTIYTAQFEISGFESATWSNSMIGVVSHSIIVQADLFSYGMFAAIALAFIQRVELSNRTVLVVRIVGLCLSAGLVATSLSIAGPVFADSLVGVACGLIIVLVQLSPIQRTVSLSRVLETKPFRLLGLWSYGLYLWHVPVIWWLQRSSFALLDSRLGLFGNFIVVCCLSLLLAGVTYALVESQALKMKKRTDTIVNRTTPNAGIASRTP
jgi:peptidoglycan/LPS O-acetylase OafA/YrhL